MTIPANTKGAALVEYGILLSLIAVLAIVSVNTLGDQVDTTFTEVSTTLSEQIDNAVSGTGSSTSGDSIVVPAGPPPLTAPTPTEASNFGSMTFSITVEYPSGVTYLAGYGAPGFGGYGSYTETANNSGTVLREFYYNSAATPQVTDDHLYLSFSGDQTVALLPYTLTCLVNGTTEFTRDVSDRFIMGGTNGFNTPSGRTGVMWMHPNEFVLNPGDELECGFSS